MENAVKCEKEIALEMLFDGFSRKAICKAIGYKSWQLNGVIRMTLIKIRRNMSLPEIDFSPADASYELLSIGRDAVLSFAKHEYSQDDDVKNQRDYNRLVKRGMRYITFENLTMDSLADMSKEERKEKLLRCPLIGQKIMSVMELEIEKWRNHSQTP